MDEQLQKDLVSYIRYKFATYPNVAELSDDIVQEGYRRVLASKNYRKHWFNVFFFFGGRYSYFCG